MIFLLRRRLPTLCFFFKHRRKYVGVQDFRVDDLDISLKCMHGFYGLDYCDTCRATVQFARWTCDRCGKMGEDRIMKGQGIFTVSFGMLVPDEKRWANFKATR